MIITEAQYIGIGYFLKSRREALNIPLDTLASKLNISIDTLKLWENECLDNIGIKEMKNLAKYLDYCPLIFIYGVPELAYIDWDKFINQQYINL